MKSFHFLIMSMDGLRILYFFVPVNYYFLYCTVYTYTIEVKVTSMTYTTHDGTWPYVHVLYSITHWLRRWRYIQYCTDKFRFFSLKVHDDDSTVYRVLCTVRWLYPAHVYLYNFFCVLCTCTVHKKNWDFKLSALNTGPMRAVSVPYVKNPSSSVRLSGRLQSVLFVM